MFKTLSILLLFLLLAPVKIPAEYFSVMPACEIIIDDFAKGMSKTWETKSFKGTTEYTWINEGGKAFIRATSTASASGLYYKIKYDTRQYPFLVWQWKVDNIIAKGDAKRKSGDDYAARIFVVFPSIFFWNTRAINYIWANKLPKGETVPEPLTKNSMMVSVQSGSTEAGKWITETRNVYADYKRIFGEEPPMAGAIAIMTDTDDTGESASACYGPIVICSKDPEN